MLISLVATPSVYVFADGTVVPAVFAGFALIFGTGLWLVNQVMSRLSVNLPVLFRLTLFLTLVYLAALPAAYFAIEAIGFGASRRDGFSVSLGVVSIGFALIALTIATADVASRGGRLIERQLEETVNELKWHLAKTKGLMWQKQQTLARALHGPVQALFTAYSIRLDLEADTARQRELATEAIVEGNKIVETLQQVAQSEVDFDADLDKIAQRWRGICEIAVDIEVAARQTLRRDLVAARTVLDLVQDGISNAVRHGSARRVSLMLSLQGSDQVAVVLADNGQGFQDPILPGVGSSQLDSLAISWTLRNLTPGAELSFSVPVAT